MNSLWERATNKAAEWGRRIDFLRRRKYNYQLAFGSPAGQEVMVDLARFCRANESCYPGTRDGHLLAEGRREVWLRIQHHLHLTSDELYTLYHGGTVKRLITEDDNE